jgi:hypothetical protein
MKESSEQQDLVRNLKLTPRKTCKSLRMFSKEELLGERGSKVVKTMIKLNLLQILMVICSSYVLIINNERYLKCGNGSIRL